MALNPSTKYPGRITAPDANYTYGSSQDETSPGAGDGTPYEKGRANDLFGLQQALLRLASIVPSGSAETQLASQYLQSLIEVASGRALNYDESGAVNVYVLDLRANQQGPAAYFEGMQCKFTAGTINTGTSTVDVNSLGVKNIFFEGVALVGGELNSPVVIEYDLSNDRFNIISEIIPAVTAFIGGKKTYISEGGIEGAGFNIHTLIPITTFESVGPTGSSPQNLWTAMDILPPQTKAIICWLHLSSAGSSVGQYQVTMNAYADGATPTGGLQNNLIHQNTSGGSETAANSTEIIIPLSSALKFQARWTTGGTLPTGTAQLFLKGFIL